VEAVHAPQCLVRPYCTRERERGSVSHSHDMWNSTINYTDNLPLAQGINFG